MVTLSVTRSRVAAVLRRAAADVGRWDPQRYGLAALIDHAASYQPGQYDITAEETSLQAWDAVTAHLLAAEGVHEDQLAHWEARPYRVTADLQRALLAAAREVEGR